MRKKLLKLWQNKFIKNYLILIVLLSFLELTFRIISNLKLFSIEEVRIFLGLNIISLLFSFITSFIPKIGAKIFNLIFILFISIYGIAELGFKNFIGTFISIQTSSQAGAVISYFWDYIRSFEICFYLMLVPFILLVIYYIYFDKKITFDLPKKKKNIKNVFYNISKVLLIIILCICYYATLKLDFMQNKTQALTSYNLFKKPTNPSLVVNDFGYIGFGILDVKEHFFPGEEVDVNVGYNPNLIPNSNIILPNEEKDKKEQVTINNEIWKNIINEENNTNYNTLNKYFISNKSTFTNSYTGSFENKNLILIMIESGSNIMFSNKELYPNLNKLYNEGWSWKNYYSPRSTCSTGNNEMSGMTGLYTIYNNCTSNVYRKNTYFESIFNLFNDKGYYTNSFHDHIDQYYYRTQIHKNMGSQKFYKVTDMNLKYGPNYGDWASDEEMMEFYLKELDKNDTDKPFMSWITTVTTHMPYSSPSTYNDKYIDMMPEEYSKDVRRYMSKLKVVDNAIGVLVDGLKKRDLLNDTVIVIYCDHYPYGIANKNLTPALGYEVNIDNNVDAVPFIIYNPSLKHKVYNEYTSYINITPTIANLFNLNYDSRLYLGSDILSDEYEEMVIFSDGSWKNKYGFYDATSNEINYYTKKVYSDEEILAINEEISIKLNMSSLAIKSNYFSYLKEKLDSYSAST